MNASSLSVAPESAGEEAHTSGGERGEGGVHETEGVSDENAPSRRDGQSDGEDGAEDLSAWRDAAGRSEAEQFWQAVSERMEQDIQFFAFRAGDAPGALVQNLRAVNRERYDYAA